LTNEDVISVLSSCAKKCRESIEDFKKGNREDLVQKAQFELDIIKSYLLEQLTEAGLQKLIKAAIDETGADFPQKIGLVMKAVMPQVQGRSDGKVINKIVSELLAN